MNKKQKEKSTKLKKKRERERKRERQSSKKLILCKFYKVNMILKSRQ